MDGSVIWFEVIAGPSQGQTFPLCDDGYVRVGRWVDGTVFLHHPTVAKHHALFVARGHHLLCRKLNEGFITRLNGQPVTPPFDVLDGDQLQVGEFVLQLHYRPSRETS